MSTSVVFRFVAILDATRLLCVQPGRAFLSPPIRCVCTIERDFAEECVQEPSTIVAHLATPPATFLISIVTDYLDSFNKIKVLLVVQKVQKAMLYKTIHNLRATLMQHA
jgi:hypothetical protein